MTIPKCREVLDRYERTLAEMHGTDITHLRGMIPKMRLMLDEMMRLEQGFREQQDLVVGVIAAQTFYAREAKFMRWLGFIQGAFWLMERYTLEELQAHNREET